MGVRAFLCSFQPSQLNLSLAEIEKLRHNTRALEIERQHLKQKLMEMEIEVFRKRISLLESG